MLEIQKWLLKIANFNFKIMFKLGDDNYTTDSLSCALDIIRLLALEIFCPILLNLELIMQENKCDEFLAHIQNEIHM